MKLHTGNFNRLSYFDLKKILFPFHIFSLTFINWLKCMSNSSENTFKIVLIIFIIDVSVQRRIFTK